MNKIVLVLCLALICGCSKSEAPKEDIKKDDSAYDWIVQQKENYIALLSAKYSIPKEAVKDIIGNVFITLTDGLDNDMNDVLAGKEPKFDLGFKPVEPVINEIATKYNITPSVVASVYVDYKILIKVDDMGSSE